MANSNDTNLKDLLDGISCGKIQLPEFQRSWTWDDNRIRGIIASVSLGYPMGAVMVLEYGNPDFVVQYRPIEGVIPPIKKNSGYFTYDQINNLWKSTKSPRYLF